ncbi:hypothetical protein FA95DRAFT_1676621 [Auriscalpium vulgare]|uniref:Uncharacterized protein n=1 Tax=Auriscalpium vulgare TaxID=40419 RepID=A0ACB8S3X5_9AGAM|nr:hypothetical protein FA95DRAFT_1676621 [Auriscalpium vulgare]
MRLPSSSSLFLASLAVSSSSSSISALAAPAGDSGLSDANPAANGTYASPPPHDTNKRAPSTMSDIVAALPIVGPILEPMLAPLMGPAAMAEEVPADKAQATLKTLTDAVTGAVQEAAKAANAPQPPHRRGVLPPAVGAAVPAGAPALPAGAPAPPAPPAGAPAPPALPHLPASPLPSPPSPPHKRADDDDDRPMPSPYSPTPASPTPAEYGSPYPSAAALLFSPPMPRNPPNTPVARADGDDTPPLLGSSTQSSAPSPSA